MRKNHQNSTFLNSIKRVNWMEMIVVLFPILTLFWMLHQDDMYMMNRIDATIREQSARTDKLYEMFIDLLNKDKK